MLLALFEKAINQKAPPAITDMAIAALDDDFEYKYANNTYIRSFAPFPKFGYVNFYARDISDRKKAEGALQKSEAHLTDFMNRFYWFVLL